jgi:hypothetical protein
VSFPPHTVTPPALPKDDPIPYPPPIANADPNGDDDDDFLPGII